jgi:tripartite-type tricarboxylate transporter receptor subunit TctC
MMNLVSKALLRLLIVAAAPIAAIAPALADATAFPLETVRLVVLAPPGGGADLTARTIASPLSALWKIPVIVENRPGAGGVIAANYVAKSKPDGSVILLQHSNFVTTAAYQSKLPYDPIKDFAPITLVAASPIALTVSSSLGVTDLKGLLDLARAKPGQLNYGSGGLGTIGHFLLAQFNDVAKVDIRHIPYQGAAPLVVAQMGGQVDLSFVALASNTSLMSGKIKALAMTGKKRSPLVPDIPTLAELGLPGIDSVSWYGFEAPAGTPKPIIDRMQKDVAAVINRPDVKAMLLAQGNEPVGSTPEEFDALIKNELALWRGLARSGRLELEK